MEASAGDGAAEKEPAEGDALAALLSQAQALTGLIEEKTAAGAEQVGGMFEGFFDEASDQDDLVDQVLQQKDETLRTLYEENEELKAQMAEYEQTVEVMMQRNSAQKEQLAAERATQQQLRDENAALVRRLQEAANVIRTTGPTAAAGTEGEGDATAAAGEENELLQKLLSDVAEVTAKNVPGAPDSTQRLEEAAELCEQGHRLFSEELVQESVASYSQALDILEPLSEAMDPDEAARVVELSVYCMVESARCYHNLSQAQQCIVTCTNVLALYPNHLDALLFRGMARTQAGPLKHARLDLEQAERVAVAEAAERGEELGDIPLLTEALEGLAAKEAEGK